MFMITQPRTLYPCDLGLENKDTEKICNITSQIF